MKTKLHRVEPIAIKCEFWRDSEDASDIRLKNHVSSVQVRPSAQKRFASEYVKGMPPRGPSEGREPMGVRRARLSCGRWRYGLPMDFGGVRCL
jgi:hypothetical protein